MAPADPANDPTPGFRDQMASRLSQWREQYAILVLDAIKANRRRRTDLARALDQLCEYRNRVESLLADLSTATDQRQWESTRFRAEVAWADLKSSTARLLQRVHA